MGRLIYVKAHPLCGYPDGIYLRLILPLYVLSESRDAWNDQLTEFLNDELNTKSKKYRQSSLLLSPPHKKKRTRHEKTHKTWLPSMCTTLFMAERNNLSKNQKLWCKDLILKLGRIRLSHLPVLQWSAKIQWHLKSIKFFTSANSIHYNQMIHSVVFTHCDIIFLGIKISSWYLSRSQHTHPQNWKSLQKFTFIIDKWPSESSSETSDLKLLFLLLYPITLKLLVFSEVSFAINEDF